MKITLDIPEWAIGKHIHIFAGSELLGQMSYHISKVNGKRISKYLPLKIKPEDGRCSGCGECCLSGFSPTTLGYMKKCLEHYDPDIDMDEPCPFLEKIGCGLGNNIPFSCIRSYCINFEGCTERLE